MNKRVHSLSLLVAFTFIFVAAAFSANEDVIDTIDGNDIHLVQGELVTLGVKNLTRLSLTDPEVADIIDADEQEVLIIGQQLGQTILFIWDDHGKRDILLNVINRDPNRVKERMKKLLGAAGIHGLNLDINDKEGKVVVSGQIADKKRDHLDRILINFSDDIIDLVKEQEIEDLVEIDLQISELNTTLTKSLGIEWSTSSGGTGAGSQLATQQFLNPLYDETLPAFDGTPKDFFKIGQFARTNALRASVQALLEEGKGRILSQPKLVVVSGEEASFLVGGEIPIRTTTVSEGATQENIEFKEFGISMTITPSIIKGNRIDVEMGVEVSDIDAANAVGDDVAFTTREADTRLVVDDGQTIIMAGLIKESESQLIKKVPFLGDVPILGILFRSRSTPTSDQDTELVIMMTPHILRASKSDMAEDDGREIDSEGTIAKYKSNAKPYYSGIPIEMKGYVRSVQDKISRALNYPPEAAQYGWEGTVKLNMLILQDGSLAFALVRESSGYDLIDDHALEIAKTNAPFSSFPPETDLQELNVTIPIVYSLNRN